MTNDVAEISNKPLTLESMMAAFNERMTRNEEAWEKSNAEWAKSRAESNAEWEKSRAERNAEWEKSNAEWEKRNAEWEKSRAKRNAEWEKSNAEWAKSRAESNAEWAKSRAEWDKSLKEQNAKIDKQIAENNKKIAAIDRQIGGMGNNNGDFAQEFFFNALYHGNRKMFGQEFHDVMPEVRRYSKKGGLKSEYDVMLLNGQSVCIVEVKYKADTDDVANVLKKEASFRANFPEFANKSLYLALASLSFHKKVEKECRKQGVAIIKQLGKTIEVFDENLKVF